MSKRLSPSPNRVVLPASGQNVTEAAATLRYPGIRFPLPVSGPQNFAPVWFYSALSWLGKTYYDASNGRQSFNSYMAGSDVDPYQSLGATRLFLIISTGNGFEMTLAQNTSSNAPTTGGTNYPNTDAGITQMYSDLSASPIFSSVNYCYIPARLFSDYDVSAFAAAANLDSGYDPATGLRAIVMGSAVAQAVPLDDFLNTHNEQIYDDSPKIVPLFTALVYDVTQNNQMNAKTFNLPTYYTRDQVSPGNYYVSNAGDQTATFQGGPGYMDADATALTVQTISQVSSQGKTFTDYNYTTATVATTAPSLGSRVQLGTSSLTYNGASPSTDFANQSIIGFYRDSTWTTCLGIPIYDYGAADSSFTSTTAGPVTPELIYDPTKPFLNGGTLQNVVQKLGSAKYFYSADRLVSILDTAIESKNTQNGAGLAVTTAALAFDMSSTGSATAIQQLAVPVLATVTTAPPVIYSYPVGVVDQVAANATLAGTIVATPVAPPAAAEALRANTIEESTVAAKPSAAVANTQATANTTVVKGTAVMNTSVAPVAIGLGANTPSRTPQAPVTVQVGLSAFIPQQALSGTGISTVEIGTLFSEQGLGDGSTFEDSSGMTVNLMDRHSATPSYAPFTLTPASVPVVFNPGVSYVLSATGTSLTVTGSDNSTSTATLASGPDANHTFIGSMVYETSLTSVELYPKLQLSLAAPGVGSNGVLQGDSYSVRLTFGAEESQYDIIDSTESLVASSISVANPTPTDGSTPQSGDLYFGSFIGGATQMTVWSVPVFLTVLPSQLTGAIIRRDHDSGCERERRPHIPAPDNRQLPLRLLEHQRGHLRRGLGELEQRLPVERRDQLLPRRPLLEGLRPVPTPDGAHTAGPDGHQDQVRLRPGGRQRRDRRNPIHAERHQP